MDLNGLLMICKAYRKLGDAVTEQIEDAAQGNTDKCNLNALEMIEREFVRVVCCYAHDDEELLDELAELSRHIKESLEDEDCPHCGGDGIEPGTPSGELEGEGEDRPCTVCAKG